MAVKTFFLIELPIHEEQTNTNRSTTKIMKLFATCLEKNSTVYGFKIFSTHQEFVQKQHSGNVLFSHLSIQFLSTVTFVQSDLCANATLM